LAPRGQAEPDGLGMDGEGDSLMAAAPRGLCARPVPELDQRLAGGPPSNDETSTINQPAGRAVGRAVADPTPRGGQRTPLASLEHVARELARVYRAAKRGDIEVNTAAKLTYILATLGKVLEAAQFEARIEALERIAHDDRPQT
jgi:hypothetical protein